MKLKYFLPTLILFCLNVKNSYAQEPNKRRFFIATGYVWQGKNTIDFNLRYRTDFISEYFDGMGGISLGTEFVFKNDKIIIAPKASVFTRAMLGAIRLSEINYLDNNSIDSRIMFEWGIDLFYGNLTYGLNLHVAGEKLDYISLHRVSLLIKLFPNKDFL